MKISRTLEKLLKKQSEKSPISVFKIEGFENLFVHKNSRKFVHNTFIKRKQAEFRKMEKKLTSSFKTVALAKNFFGPEIY